MAKKMVAPEAVSMKDSKYEDWNVEDACRTLMRAEEIKSDKKMMKLVKAKLDKQEAAITSIKQLREIAKQKNEDMDSDSDY